ncbi:hypothetical protein CLCR_06710 [Cladophialophora carrionii]|uniref:5'-3' DNA helicase ZGRF1-like N-terminal domain-containing protein n=1 Tax=Cladophialophora carrionii TaxID=86049 RepID=A0A1C1CQE7_9EURO|nr:hypothetical protein CLCR_06710 [Cladophialophora carrionii]
MAALTPGSQSTAPVHEFRCLYTRDLHKKSKKWHDGSVRFHTFNRRVMAYDDSGTFIDDVHYRQEEEFAEGVEIRLDRGVLVEVGERLGQTQTDLAPILDRQRAEKAQSPRRQPLSRANRLQATASSQRPKSLSEVLGPSQGRLGRARILYQSPYEQRYTSARREQPEPSPKRQRLSSDKEDRFDGGHPSIRPARPGLPQPKQPSKPIPHPSRPKEPPIEFEEVLDLSADDEPKRHPPMRVRLTAKSKKTDKEAPEKPTLTSGFSCPRSTSLVRPVGFAEQAGKDKGSGKKPKHSSNSNKPSTRTHPITSRSSSTKTARLLLGRPKPRQKLTCVLPFSSGPSIGEPVARPPLPSPCRKTVSTSLSPTAKALPLDTDGQTVADEPILTIESPSCRSSIREPQSSPHHGISSPLFMPEDNVDPTSPPPSQVFTQEEFPFSNIERSETFDDLGNVGISLRSIHARGPQSSPQNGAETEGGDGPAEQTGSDTRLEPEPQDGAESPSAAKAEDHVQSQSLQNPEEAEIGQDVDETGSRSRSEIVDTVECGEQEKAAEPEPETRSAPKKLVIEERQTEAGKGVGNHEQVETRRIPQLCINNVPQPFTSRAGDRLVVQNQPSPSSGHAAGFQGRSFRRVLSENDALDEEDRTPVPRPDVSNPRHPLGLLENLTTRRSSVKSRSPSKVQRCASDTLACDTAEQYVSRPPAEGSKGPTGPWTVEEAFLLFDWWPAELEKPGYWIDTTVEPVSRALREPHSNWGGITTARQFLRDDVHAL